MNDGDTLWQEDCEYFIISGNHEQYCADRAGVNNTESHSNGYTNNIRAQTSGNLWDILGKVVH